MAAPSRGLYIFVSICCFMVIPLGLLAPKVGPKLIDAWKFRKLGRPVGVKGRLVGYVVSSGGGISAGESVLLDVSGKDLRRWPTSGAGFGGSSDCYGLDCLSNGNVLFGGSNWVREFDREGKEVWRLPDTAQLGRVTSVQRLANGNTLVAEGDARRAREFTPAGAEAWRYQTEEGNIFSAERLRNGNTLLALYCGRGGLVREVDPRGTTVWEIEPPPKSEGRGFGLFAARRLANGNSLLAGYEPGDGVVEVDPAGRVVWKHPADGAVSAERLPDGRTLISQYSPGRVVLVSPDGKEEVLYANAGTIGRACPVYAGR
jgi:hypothetical protein